MSPHRAVLAAFVLSTVATVFLVAPAPAHSQDFSCHPAKEHCVAAARDNYTIYVDTDGSMNADSGVDNCCGGGTDSYWDIVEDDIEDFADDNHNGGGDCKVDPDPSKCKAKDCDGVRLGIGFFGDDSMSHPDSDGLRAYQAESAGENKRNDVKDAINNESAGNMGLPGIETIACPPNGPGQTDTITCPTMGTLQESEIHCPPDGGVQIDEIGCPFDGTAQVHRLRCPPDAVKQRLDFNVFSSAPGANYQINVGTASASFFNNPFVPQPVTVIAASLASQLAADPYIIANFDPPYALAVGATVRLTHTTAGATSATSMLGFISLSEIPVDPSGLPSDPPVGTDYDFDLNGDQVRYTSAAGDLSDDVCDGLAAELISVAMSQGHNVTASSSAGVLTITSTLAGEAFTVDNVSSDLVDDGVITANLPGIPGDPAAAKEFDFRINGTKVDHDHIGAGETAQNICDELALAVDASGEDVSATVVNAGVNGDGKIDWRLRIQSTVVGQSFSITSVDPDLRDFGTVQANMAGLPGDPGAGHVYDFTLNSSLIQHTGDATSSQASVCGALAAAVTASSEPVTVTNFGSYIRIRPQVVGELFTISSVDSELMHVQTMAGSSGLPGTPGSSYVYSWDYTDYAGTMSTINVASPGAPTTASVCTAIQTELNLMPEFVATMNASMNQITITPATQGFTWTFSNMDPFLSHTTSLTGDLPNNPGPLHTYNFRVDGTDITFVDDGTPTQAEVCTGMMNAINATVGGTVTAVNDGSTITMTGTSSAAFDVTNVPAELSPHIVVREAGLGPASWGQLASRINSDLNITTRNQNAVAITHRGPDDWLDFTLAVDQLCAKRDDTNAPAKTYFIGVDISATERDLLSILAAAGGTGTCSGGVDPCAVANATLVNPATMSPLVSCSGAYSVGPWSVDNALENIKWGMSCTFTLDVPPTYPDGDAPNNTNATKVWTLEWENECDDDLEIPYNGGGWAGSYFWDLYDCHDDSWFHATNYYHQGWQWPSATNRKQFTLEGRLCAEVQAGNIEEIESHVGCLCANQGDECTAAFTDPVSGAPIPCKSPTHGRCTPGMDPAVCSGGTATGECTSDGYCLQTCTAEQLAAMRCATGVYLCDEDTGTETCTAGGDNIMPEICNGIDDDCDGLVDNMSNNDPMAFDGYDTEGRDCNGADACRCPDGWTDTPSASMDIQEHLDSFSGECDCGESLAGPEANMSVETEPFVQDDEPTADGGPSSAACSIATGEGRGDLVLLGLLGLLGLRRRRRRA